jgi:hypothetical protein
LDNAAVTLRVCLVMSFNLKATSNIEASKKIGYSDKYLITINILKKVEAKR